MQEERFSTPSQRSPPLSPPYCWRESPLSEDQQNSVGLHPVALLPRRSPSPATEQSSDHGSRWSADALLPVYGFEQPGRVRRGDVLRRSDLAHAGRERTRTRFRQGRDGWTQTPVRGSRAREETTTLPLQASPGLDRVLPAYAGRQQWRDGVDQGAVRGCGARAGPTLQPAQFSLAFDTVLPDR